MSDHKKTMPRIPQWLMILVALLCIPLTGWTYLLWVQSTGKRSFERNLQVQKDRGYPTTIEDLYALTPPVDVDRQERLWTVLERIDNWDNRLIPHSFDVRTLRVHGRISVQQASWDALIKHAEYPTMRSDIQELAHILSEGSYNISSIGWMKTQHNNHTPAPDHQYMEDTTPLTAIQNIHKWTALTLLSDNSPEPDKSACINIQYKLTQLLMTQTSVIDAMLAYMTTHTNDSLNLYRLWASHTHYIRHSPPPLDTDHDRKIFAQNSCAEFITFPLCIVKSQPSSSHFVRSHYRAHTWYADIARAAHSHFYSYWNYHYLEKNLDNTYCYAQFLDGHRTDSTASLESPINLLSFSNESLYVLLIGSAHDRMCQLSAMLLTHYQQHASLPADTEALRKEFPTESIMLDGGIHTIGLTYERLDAGRFRFGLDDSVSPPYGMPHKRIKSIYGKPFTAPYNFYIERHYIEINAAHTQQPLPSLLKIVPTSISTSKKIIKK